MGERDFEILGEIREIEIIAVGRSIRQLSRRIKSYGEGRWRKLKGIVLLRLSDGFQCPVEIHWYEMNSVGKKELKIKRLLYYGE